MSDNLFEKTMMNPEEKRLEELESHEKERLKGVVSERLAQELENKVLFGTKDKEKLYELQKQMNSIIKRENGKLSNTKIQKLVKELTLEITSLGKLHPLLEDKEVTEIMVNASKEVWVEKRGKLLKTDVEFKSEKEVYDLAQKIANNCKRIVNNTTPLLDARLPDGSRVNVVLKGIADKGTTITIRKFPEKALKIDDLIGFGSLDEKSARLLRSFVETHCNIIVSGGTGSGKTTCLNVVSDFIPKEERVVTIEDSLELQTSNEHVVALEKRDKNSEGKGEVTIRQLVANALRMRPDRIVVGEVRGATAFDLIQAMNTGHDGSLATIHANTPQDCISRLELLVLQTGMEIPTSAIKRYIAGAVDIIVQTERLVDGSRRITDIAEVTDYNAAEDNVETQSFMQFGIEGYNDDGSIIGKHSFTGYKGSEEINRKFRMKRRSLEEELEKNN